MFIDVSNIGHDLLPVGPLNGDHLCQVQTVVDPNSSGRFESYCEIPPLLTGFQRAIGNPLRHVGVEHGTEGHPIVPGAREVGDVYINVSCCFRLTPFQKSITL